MCDACQTAPGAIGIGSAMLCRSCEPAVTAEIETVRAAGKPVNALHIARRIFKTAHSGGNYLLRDVPAELWPAVKHRAVDDGCAVRDVVLSALRAYVK